MRPDVMPAVLADALAAAPARVTKRLDAAPGAAEAWQWSPEGAELHVNTGQETVRLPLGGLLTDIAQITCTCLLTPRCLHTLSVLSALPLATPDTPSPGEKPDPSPAQSDEPPASGTPRTPSQADPDQARPTADTGGPAGGGPGGAAAGMAWEAGAEVLAAGVAHAGAAARERLLRAAHACAEARLYTLARLTTAVAQGVHDVRAKRPEFELARYAQDLADLLRTARRPDTDPGTGRRRYEALPPLILQGLFSEPVVTASGYAGVVTWLADETGQLYTVADVTPGGAERVAAAYRAAVRFGGLALSPERLGRSRVFAQNAAASADGRLSSTKDTKAAIHGVSTWTGPPWTEPPADQLARALRGERDGLMFLRAEPAGRDLRTGAGTLTAIGATPTGEANLRKLTPAHESDVIVRVVPDQPGVVTVLAVDQQDLSFTDLPGPSGPPLPPRPGGRAAPLTPLRRVLHRVAMGGRATAGPTAAATIAATAARLRRDQLPTAAALLERLAGRAAAVRRTVTGESLPEPPGELARVWSAAMTYAERAEGELTLRRWRAAMEPGPG
ncbi:hypothetical protein [Nonomuraea endophytica]|uniref:SWIM-type domain-containing protein n=1 Tax=Nonomuraea endophytica TaxID=714136 RepID=A0A7W8EGL0_9ACTN|nr:hypothetical protein [Nonomuraea endophytica]MBB5078506.1 hypothetical protein [Nonomuraea endophytica]